MTREVSALVVSPAAPVWGAQLYLLDQVDALATRGVRLTLASPPDSPFAEAWVERGHPLRPVQVENHAGLRRRGSTRRESPLSMARTAWGIARGTRALARVAKDYDLLYSFSLRSHAEVVAAGKLARTPVALDLVDIVRPGLGRKVLRAVSRAATLTVANSRASADTLPAGVPVRVIHPGIDLERFRPGPVDPALRAELTGGVDRAVIAVIGRIDVTKGVQVAVDAMTQLTGAAANARLVVVGTAGTGPREFAENLERDATQRLGDRVMFAGRRDDVPDILRAVDVLVVASMAEPFGLTALEAQACGTPVVGTRSGGLVEFVEHEVTGLLVPPNEAEPLARAIERVLSEPELSAAMVAEARRRADPARGVPAQIDEIARMYRDVASGHVDRRPTADPTRDH